MDPKTPADARRRPPVPALVCALLAGACAAPRSEAPGQAPPPPTAGLVIGTLSYQFAGSAPGTGPWRVEFERLGSGGERQHYALVAIVDPESQSGVFSGVLPAGMYTFRNALAHELEFAPGAFRLPFEVQAGRVQDAGHYAVSPATVEAQLRRAR